MKKLSKDDFAALREGATVIEADLNGDKVLLLADGTYLKLFRVKRLFTTARFYPYSKRFVKNVRKLMEKGIPTVTVVETYRIPSISRTAVHYYPLTGKTLRKLDKLDMILANKLGKFIRELHEKGVYFRSLHLGNIVVSQENRLGLIDVADMKVFNKPLPSDMRKRSFDHLARYQNDVALLQEEAYSFYKGYFDGQYDLDLEAYVHRILIPEPPLA